MTQLKSLIFIDGGDPEETRKAKEALGHIDGQTTNPTLVSKNPEVVKYLAQGKKLTADEALAEYKKIVEAVAQATDGPISIQVIADEATKADEMLRQARVYKTWIPNGVVKFPCTGEGLAAAEVFCQEFPVNITLNFSQEQAAAVYVATKDTKHRVFVSPFVGRLDDRGENGMQVVENELRMFKEYAEGPEQSRRVEVLTASVRSLNHFLYALALHSPAITVPFKIFEEWQNGGFKIPDDTFRYDSGKLTPISYRNIPLNQDWRSYDLRHELTDKGLAKFMEDWQAMLKV